MHSKITACLPLENEMKAALRYYCKFHLKPGDLETVPELKNYMEFHDNNSQEEKPV